LISSRGSVEKAEIKIVRASTGGLAVLLKETLKIKGGAERGTLTGWKGEEQKEEQENFPSHNGISKIGTVFPILFTSLGVLVPWIERSLFAERKVNQSRSVPIFD